MSSIAFRPPLPTDHNFILSSWLESFRRSPNAGVLPDKPFYDSHRAHLEELLSRPSARVLCCYSPSEAPPNDLFGFIAWQPGVLHYVYVKHAYRKMGVAKALVLQAGLEPEKGLTYTYRTRVALDYAKAHHAQRWKFDPRYARYDLCEQERGRLGEVPVRRSRG